MRNLLLVLLLANAAFFAWAQGWLAPALPAPRHSEREPQRLLAQVRPDSVVVLAPQAASAALLAARGTARACLEAGPLTEAEASSAETSLATVLPAVQWQRDKREVSAATTATAAAQMWLRVASATIDQQNALRALPAGFKPCLTRP